MKNIIIYIVTFVIVLTSLTGCQSEEMKTAISEYDSLVKRVGERNAELDNVIFEAESLIHENNPILDETLIPLLETAISEGKAVKEQIPERPKQIEEIIALSKKLESITYSAQIKSVKEKQKELEISIKKYSLVNNPTEDYIIECLNKVGSITGISAVTEENDPNGKLNKAGGYTAQIYFSSELINQNEVLGSTIIEKGTNCGGSIEVYAKREAAEARNEYLATFDGGLIASGSHTVIGTVVIRTSNELTASQQKALETDIIEALTSI